MAGDISVLFVLPTSLCAEFDGFLEWKWNNIAIGNTLTNEILLNNVAMTFNMRVVAWVKTKCTLAMIAASRLARNNQCCK